MKAKKSSKKAASVAAGPRKQLLYSFDAEKAKALRSDEYKGKESLVATLLNVLVAGRKEQYNFAEMADLYKAETGKPVSRAQFPLNKLKALKVLKATKEREAPAPAKASKAKRSKKAKLEVVDQPSAA